MADPTILHLTDLHFGWDRDAATKAERQIVLDGLVEHVVKLPGEWRPHWVCISGDIGWKGKADDYALAKAWLTNLLGRLGLGFERVIVCAGNHDVDRSVAERIARPSDAKDADQILRAPIAPHNLSAFAAFTDFCKSAGITRYTFQGEPSYLLGHTVQDGVRFVACNSAWFCKDEHDKGKLWLGLPLVRLIESEGGLRASAGEPTVCLIHHPPDWWHEAETNATPGRPNTRDYLAHRTDLILTGHTHGEVRKADRIAQGALHLTGGAGYNGPDHYNSYRLIRIGKKSLQWRSFEYDPRSADGAWRDHGAHTVPFVEGPPETSQVAPAQQSLAADVARLAVISREPMEDVSTAVEGLPPLDRAPLVGAIEERLAEHGVCLAAGESGSGKSAVAKTLGQTRYGRVVWLTAECLHAPDAERLREKLGLHNPLSEALASSLGTSLVVIDGAERCSDEALRQVARLVKEVRGHPEGGQVRILVTLQLETARRVVSRLKVGGIDKAATELIEVERPDEEAVGELLSSVHTLSWAALRPELRALLTNLKLLDWVVRATSAGLEFGEGQPVTLTALVDRLWARWVERDGSAYGRSGLLMKLGELEGTTLADGVPLGTYRGLRFGMLLTPHFAPEVYLEGATPRSDTLARDHHGPRAVLNALDRLANAYESACVRVRQDLAIAEGQLRDYRTRHGSPYQHDAYLLELTGLRDQLKASRSGGHFDGTGPAREPAELARRIKALKATHSIEATPERAGVRRIEAEEPVTARIRRRTGAIPEADRMLTPVDDVGAVHDVSGKSAPSFQERLAAERRHQADEPPASRSYSTQR